MSESPHFLVTGAYGCIGAWVTRELDENDLESRIDALAVKVPDMNRAIFNLHVPPYYSDLDVALRLDAEFRLQFEAGHAVMVPVGSTAVRAAIERYQPLLDLRGHVREAKGAEKIGRTLCINPGSSYNTGRIDGVLVHLDDERVKGSQFVSG